MDELSDSALQLEKELVFESLEHIKNGHLEASFQSLDANEEKSLYNDNSKYDLYSSDCSDPLVRGSLQSVESEDNLLESTLSERSFARTKTEESLTANKQLPSCKSLNFPSPLKSGRLLAMRQFSSQPSLKFMSTDHSQKTSSNGTYIINHQSSILENSSLPTLVEEVSDKNLRIRSSPNLKSNINRSAAFVRLSGSLPQLPSSHTSIWPIKKPSHVSSSSPTNIRLPPLRPSDLNQMPINTKVEERRSSSESLTVFKPLSASSRKNSYNVLPAIQVREAKNRPYLLGNLSSKYALLGSTEMNRYFPSQKIHVFIVTWNVNGLLTNDSIDEMLLPDELGNIPDIYAIGIQEATSDREKWEVKLQETIGPTHVLFCSEMLGSLHLAIFLRRDLIWFCSVPESATINTRIGSNFKTKGAVAISFMFFGTSFLFITSHFTAHDAKVKERLLDYERIISSLNLPQNIPLRIFQKSKDVTERFDCVFWCGDLNFRLDQDRVTILNLVETIGQQMDPNFEDLLREDQLRKNMSLGVVFKGFNEARVNFQPTYKYDVGTQIFDTSHKQRTPSYTDRILYRTKIKNIISCILYNSIQSLISSDHRPVCCFFEVCIQPGRDNVPLAAGQFNRDVYLKAMQRRAHQMDVLFKPRSASCSSVCLIM